ncbi:glycosyltransferase [Flavobacteriaceae bacterium]|jgi:glycosyltransferase involved in cell wall biosynthesis|nr:glycosyltransferase [Flavobacteriaceae bacterium]
MSIFDFILIAFSITIGLQFIYYGVVFSKFAFAKIEYPPVKNIPISVIICAKNEAHNLPILIPKLLTQDYSTFEIILINDHSIDNTLEIMESFKNVSKLIKIVNVKSNETFWGSKKYALTLGIKASTYNYLLFTDADCIPATDQWIMSMASHFSNKKSIVIGYGAYKKQKNSILNKLIRYETLLTAIQYFGFSKIGMPYMGVGRNLAYRKETFFNVNGFVDHLNIKSGDDDLFINQVATSSNVSNCFKKESFTISVSKSTWGEWYCQKRRHISTANHYKIKHQIILGLFYISQLFFWLLACFLLLFSFNYEIVISLILLRCILTYLILGYSARKLDELDVVLLLPFLEIFLIISQFSIFITNCLSKPVHWK